MAKSTAPKPRSQGMHWIANESRLAKYSADGFACGYCAKTVEEGARLTLDHLRPYSKGGSNHPSNLITCCDSCNSARGNRPWGQFAEKVAGYLNIDAAEIKKHINRCRRRKLDRKAAKAIIARRPSWKALVENNYK
ncbi:MAG: HNH endonuclease [Desulfobacteraceae bacterium]|nr:HNH endonuclease [Desulfobacteraceae bacterium]